NFLGSVQTLERGSSLQKLNYILVVASLKPILFFEQLLRQFNMNASVHLNIDRPNPKETSLTLHQSFLSYNVANFM
ncbi:hypothetical protein, partial [Priestia megaterium]